MHDVVPSCSIDVGERVDYYVYISGMQTAVHALGVSPL